MSSKITPLDDDGNDQNTNENGRMPSKRIMKNIIVMSFVFFMNFLSYGGLSSLQSSLHIDEGMGTTTQSVLYAAMVISCLFLPKLATIKLGHKWCVALSLLGYIAWMAANGYAVWATMIPTCILVGICASTLWTGQCSYFTIMAKEYARQTKQTEEAVIALFFGVFFMIFQSSFIFGSIISSTVLQQAPPANFTGPSNEELELCGINDCPGNNQTNINLEKPAAHLVWTLVVIYIIIAIGGFATACIFIDNIPAYLIEKSKKTAGKEVTDSLKATIFHMRHRNQLLLIPITIYSGLEQTFKGADWNKSFITCNIGIWMIGYISIPSFVSNALMSFSGGRIMKYTGRMPVFLAAVVIDTGLILTYNLWEPEPDILAPFFIIPIFGSMSDAVWQTQINTMYGSLFPNESEAAFANYRLWESLGFVIAFAYSSYICTFTKLMILASFLTVGTALYMVLEWVEKQKVHGQEHVNMKNISDMDVDETKEDAL